MLTVFTEQIQSLKKYSFVFIGPEFFCSKLKNEAIIQRAVTVYVTVKY